MNEMIDSKIDKKRIVLLKTLCDLRQALDINCIFSANGKAINELDGKPFLGYVYMLCQRSAILSICKIFEEEKQGKRGKVQYELDSINGILRYLDNEEVSVLNSDAIRTFVLKYEPNSNIFDLTAISAVITNFRTKYTEPLTRFKTLRDKWVAHPESGFGIKNGPSYYQMEQMFNFGHDFHTLISRAFIAVGPADINNHRYVKISLTRMLKKLGCKEIKTELE